MRWICLVLFNALYPFYCLSQEQRLTLDGGENWQWFADNSITDNGKYIGYVCRQEAKEDRVVFQDTSLKWKKEISDFTSPYQFARNSNDAIFRNKADSLVILTLGTDRIEYIPNIESFKVSRHGKRNWLGYQEKDRDVVIRDLLTNKEQRFKNIIEYLFSEDGTAIVLKREYAPSKQELVWVSLAEKFKESVIWAGENAVNLTFSQDFTSLAFISSENIYDHTINTVWQFKKGAGKAIRLIDDRSATIDGQFTINQVTGFTKNGSYILFSTKKKNDADNGNPVRGNVKVDVWSYLDPKLQSQQLSEMHYSYFNPEPTNITAVSVETGRSIRLEKEKESILGDVIGEFALLYCKGNGDTFGEWNWNRTANSVIDLVSLKDGTRRRIFDNVVGETPGFFRISPNEQYVVYYNPLERDWFSYNVLTGVRKCLTKELNSVWTTYLQRDEPDAGYRVLWPGGFTKDGRDIFIYDQNDIFQVDLSGEKAPVNLTNGYGRRNNIAFRMIFNINDGIEIEHGERLILNAFDRNNNNNGFYRAVADKETDPTLLTMQPCMFVGADEAARGTPWFPPVKAKNEDIFIVTKQGASEFPNFFLTKDFRKFQQISYYYPERAYNWLTAELHTWKSLNGNNIKGVLYKPGDFDSTKKYPVIFYYYEKLSETMHLFRRPGYMRAILDIPYFVSNGYLVFVPDIPKIMGHPGPSAVNAVVSAANYLSTKSYVDSTRLGLQGHSFGGFETNYIITHSNKFAAAMSAASMTNFISCYGSIMWLRNGESRQKQYEIYHDAIGASMWERPDCYIENSPVLYADKVTTPVLMMNNISDSDVPFAQGVEFFTALRRLGKRAWMLQYDEEGHSLGKTGLEVCKDFTIRMRQFFDHYLKDKPAPVWMTRGIPAKYKGIKNGFEYDTEIKTPIKGGLLTPEEKQKIDSFKNRQPFTTIIP